MFMRMSLRLLDRTSARTSSSVGIFSPGDACWLGNAGSVLEPQSSVSSCFSVRSCTSLPTYGNCGSPACAGAVSAQIALLTVLSCVTTSLPSRVTMVSISRVEVSGLPSAKRKAASVFSGWYARPPRWASTSNGDGVGLGSLKPRAAATSRTRSG